MPSLLSVSYIFLMLSLLFMVFKKLCMVHLCIYAFVETLFKMEKGIALMTVRKAGRRG